MPKLNSVLLVDDDNTTTYQNKLLLTRMEVAEQLLVAVNGQEALATVTQTCSAARTGCPTLILLDINMPVMGGLEFLEAYQQLPSAYQQAVIVLLTTSSNLRDLERAQQLPIAGILSKPLTSEKVHNLLQTHFPSV